MEKTNFLRFLILWVTLSQGFAFSPDNRAADSSNVLERKRRVIDRTPNANTQVQLRDAFYVVNVRNHGVHVCAGSILAAQVILTTAQCILQPGSYTVISGTVSKRRGGTSHSVNGILKHPQFRIPFVHNIALLSISPPITFGENLNRPIPIFHSDNGQLPPNTLVTVSGYGITLPNHRGGVNARREGELTDPNELRTIHLPTISRRVCQDRDYYYHPFITNEIICTFHAAKCCSPDENGNPLVYNGHLVGILVLDKFFEGDSDFFLSVAGPQNRNWIMSHMSPENIPRYIPSPPNSPPHHQSPENCSPTHPCNH